jgi:glycine cleavage system aminomethyltransferase T
MRKSPVADLLRDRGAVFKTVNGVEIPWSYSSFEEEYQTVRDRVGLTDFSFTMRYKVKEAGLDVFERYAAGSVANLRFGRILHTMAVNPDGFIETDLYIANDDEELILIGETLLDDETNRAVLDELGAADAGAEDISATTALFGVDGFNAWAVVKDLLGPDVLGLPYMSIETYDLDGVEIKLVRAGKTSEFGYLVLVPAKSAADIWQRIEAAGKPHGLGRVGFDAHMALRLDGRFFNIHEEGAAVRDPLPLGLQWMMDLEGDDYRGRDALMQRRKAGVSRKIIGVVTEDEQHALERKSLIKHGDRTVATVVTARYSPTLKKWIGLALFEREYAFACLDFQGEGGNTVSTVSMPPFTAKSLTVRLDEM